jgi:hypothetical protein
MYRRQRGVTFIGWLFLLIPVALVLYAGIRLAPMYLNYMRVVRALDSTASEVRGGDDASTHEAIRVSLLRHLEVDSVEFPTMKEISIRRDGRSWVIEAKYEDEQPLFSNISLVVAFDKVATIG